MTTAAAGARENEECPGLGGLGGVPTQAIGASFWLGPAVRAGKQVVLLALAAGSGDREVAGGDPLVGVGTQTVLVNIETVLLFLR